MFNSYSFSFSSSSSIFIRGEPSEDEDDDENDRCQIENCSRTSTGTRTGRPVCAFIGHQSVRAVDNSWLSLLLRISVNRSKVSRVALPTHVRNTTSSPRHA